MRSHVGVALALLSVAACSQVGREIVGRQVKGAGDKMCSIARRCGQLEVEAPQGVPGAARLEDLAGCPDSPSCPMGWGDCGTDSFGSDEIKLAWWSVREAPVTCNRTQLIRGAGDGDALDADGAVLRRVVLDVASETPLSIELTHAELSHVAFDLHGPVSVHLIDSAKLEDVRLMAEGPAQLLIEGGNGDGLALAAGSGSAILRRVRLKHMRAELAELELESVGLANAELAVGRFQAVDATLDHLTVNADRVLLSSSTVDMSDFGPCSAFSGISGSFKSTNVSACIEPHRLYGTAFDNSRVDGAFTLDRATLTLTEVGVADSGPVDVWDSTLKSVSFCADQQAFSFGGHSTVSCGRCDLAETPVEPVACVGELADFALGGSETCSGFDEPAACGFDLPRRMRPPL